MATVGWPFLVARGRRRGYTILLAPDFLVADGVYGFLEELVGPTREVRTAGATTHDGRHVCLVWTEYRVCATDLADGPADPVDEHSRPLRLLYGFLSVEPVSAVAAADLDLARGAALAAYRRFLTDEDGFRVLRSAGFPIASRVDAPETRVRVAARTRNAGPRLVAGAMAALVVLAVVLAVTVLGGGGGPAPAHTPPVTPTMTFDPGSVSTFHRIQIS